MKKYLFLATAAIAALASCSSDEVLGGGDVGNSSQGTAGAISFTSGSRAITRASGAEAAALLNKNFVVEGIKTVGDPAAKVEVFDNYNVNWTANTADKTASNTANWEYVGQAIIGGSKTAVTEQTIKYWDFAASQYDFWAYSLGDGSATVSTLAHDATLTSAAYTITGTLTNLSKVYISDLVTAYNPTVTDQPVFGNQVNLSFRSLVSKVRIGLYETIPGYSIKSVQFYPSADGTAAAAATLYASSAVLPSVTGEGTGTYTVSFPTIGSSNVSNADYNKAHIAYASEGTKAASIEFGSLSYGDKEKSEKTEGATNWLARTSATPTWAVETGKSAGDYSIVIPYETGAVLTLKVDYTLESIDGSGETITVHGATALVPAQYTQWKPNYAYTYLFKISDNTNGKTNASVDKVGLYPITLDAVVVGSEDGTQETITTVATPSITTYSITSNVTTNNEYTTSDDIYVTATTDGTFINMSDKATLYKVSSAATEAQVLEALTIYKSETSGTYVGRNDVTLTPVSGGLTLTGTTIPLVDGTEITGLTAGQVALIDKSKLDAGNTYAFVYETTTGDAPTATPKYEAIDVTGLSDVKGYYTKSGETYTEITETTSPADGTTYYEKYFTIAKTYAIKVIKIKA
ncbi:MAG: hypothetical protein IJ637_08310 [Prevotella sp.]|nr:hypothetical protein [Prevotella sp.]